MKEVHACIAVKHLLGEEIPINLINKIKRISTKQLEAVISDDVPFHSGFMYCLAPYAQVSEEYKDKLIKLYKEVISKDGLASRKNHEPCICYTFFVPAGLKLLGLHETYNEVIDIISPYLIHNTIHAGYCCTRNSIFPDTFHNYFFSPKNILNTRSLLTAEPSL